MKKCINFYYITAIFSLSLVTYLLLTNTHADEQQKPKRPNIVFIYTDDQSFNTIASLGHQIVKTPNFDRLAQEGIAFTNAYNQGGWHVAICAASRAMINSGRFLWNARQRLDEDLRPESRGGLKQPEREIAKAELWSQLLKNGGYTTYFTGKWHVSIPVKELFDHVDLVRGPSPPMERSIAQLYQSRPIEGEDDVWSPFDPQFQGHWGEDGKHWAESLADSAIGFINDASKRNEPFFMYLAFNSPHDPRQAPKEYVDLYPQEKMDVPINFVPENPYKDVMGCSANLRDEKFAPFPRTEYAVRIHRREYYAIISHLDTQIGRILNALEKSGKKESTYLFLTADNGLAIGAHGLFGKQNLYEHSVKVPLLVVGPGLPKNQRIVEPVYLQDIVPTSLNVAGIDIPDHVQFRSLLPLIHGEEQRHYGAIYGAYMMLQRMVRKGDFKLIVYPEKNIRLLFDLKNDLDEINNLTDKPEYAAKVQELLSELRTLQKETGDPLTLNTEN
ncbi:MAG: sulfatase-like hydrolase/transferase [Planctomycetaceae bacterium]|jgi:choline-sulfatase|nr:sulfatase-like hydrolase/transferase [Planctomycetaceae bacterium]